MNCGDPMTEHRNPFDSEQATVAVTSHLARYRLTVPRVIARLPQFATMSPREAARLLRALQNQHLLGSAMLWQGQPYWHLTATGAQHCGIANARIGPHSEPAKIRAYAMLRFCCLAKTPRHLLTAMELDRHFPGLGRQGLPSGYFFDPQGEGRLGLLRVDAGHRGRWDRVVASLREDISNHVRQNGFLKLVQARRFYIVLLTVLPQKARRVTEALAAYPDSQRIEVLCFPMPDLLPLITSIPRKEATPR